MTRRNTDESLRELEREARSGDVDAAVRWFYAASRAKLIGDGRPEEFRLETPYGKLGLIVVSDVQAVIFAIGDHHYSSPVRIWGTHDHLEIPRDVPALVVDGLSMAGDASYLWRRNGDETPDGRASSGCYGGLFDVAKKEPPADDWSSGAFVPWYVCEEEVVQRVSSRTTRRTGTFRTQRMNTFHFRATEHGPQIPRHSRGQRREAAQTAAREFRERDEEIRRRLEVDLTRLLNRWLFENLDVLRRARRNRLAREIAKERQHLEWVERDLRKAQEKLGQKVIEALSAG